MDNQISRAERIKQIRADFSVNSSTKGKRIKVKERNRENQVNEENYGYYKGFIVRIGISLLLFVTIYLGNVKLEETLNIKVEQIKPIIAKNDLVERLEVNTKKIVEETVIPAMSRNGISMTEE